MRQQEEDREVREVSETWPQVATLLFLRPAPLGAGKEKTEFLKSTLYFPFISIFSCVCTGNDVSSHCDFKCLSSSFLLKVHQFSQEGVTFSKEGRG